MPRFDKILETLIHDSYSADVNIINPPSTAISWGKVWGDVGTNQRTTLKCEQMPTRLTQLDAPQYQVKLESTPIKIRVMHRDYECKNFRPPMLENMENYLITMIWQNISADYIKQQGVNHMLPAAYNYVDTDLDGIFELNIIVNMFFFRKLPPLP